MQWPYTQRLSSGTALAVISLGAGVGVGLMGVFASMQGARPGYRWWWPTEWMMIPAVVTALGLLLLAVPVRAGHKGDQAAAVEPRGAGGEDLGLGRTPTGSIGAVDRSLGEALPGASNSRIGVGVPGYTGPFRRAVQNLSSQSLEGPDGQRLPVSILDPRGDLYEDGPGVVQDFDARDSDYGWALCALPGRPVVAVDGKIWADLRAEGSAALDEHPRTALGYPVSSEDETCRIDATALSIELTGGTFGDGLLVREAVGRPWHWEPTLRLSKFPISQAASWDRDSHGERLRLRIVSVLPYPAGNELAATRERREVLLTRLADCALAGYLTGLSAARGAELTVIAWEPGPNHNARDRLSYSCRLETAEGRTVLFAQVFMELGKYMSGNVETWVEIEVHSLDAWRAALSMTGGAPPEDLRITTAELAEFFALGWQTATVVLPATVGQLPTRYSRPPVSQFIVGTDRASSGQYPPLEQYIDLRPLGPCDRDHLERMTIALTSAPPRDHDHAVHITRTALTEMAQLYTFLDAGRTSFQ